MDQIENLKRELRKAREALQGCQTQLGATAEANAALHCASEVFYSPLHAKVTMCLSGIELALKEGDNGHLQDQVPGQARE